MKENINDANPADNVCATHKLSNSEKKVMAVANYSEDFRKKFQKVIQYPGKTRDPARDIFDETIVDADGFISFF